ncbi:MAG: S-layer homology domain-containing protein [Clostridiales bacterium]|nr:S-layer homology domain-containing protein [Clostridiales bacterium]
MRKKFLSLLIAAVMVLAMVPATAFAGSMEFCPEPEAVEVEAVEDEEIEAEEIEVEENQNAGIMLLTIQASTLPTAVNGVITLDDDYELTEAYIVSSDVTIDLNGHTITKGSDFSGYLIGVVSGVTLTIKDSTGGGKIDGGSTQYYYGITTNGEVIVESGEVTGYYGIYVSGTDAELTVTGGTVSGTNRAIHIASGEVTIEGGTVSSEDNYGIIQSGGTLTVTGGMVSGGQRGINVNDGELTIEGGTITGGNYGVIQFGGTTEISGGTVSGYYSGVYATGTSTSVTISGNAVVKSTAGKTTDDTSTSAIAVWYGATLVIDDGTIDGGYCGIICYHGYESKYSTVIVNGGDIYGSTFGISTNSASNNGYNYIEVNGGTVTGGATGMYLPAVDSETVITGGTITGGNTGIEIRAGDLTVTGGTISGGTSDSSNQGNGSGTTTTGAGIAVSQHTTNQKINVNITGGTITGYYGVYEVNTNGTGNYAATDAAVTITISGDTTNVIGTGTAVYSDSKSGDDDGENSDHTYLTVSGGNFSDPVNKEYLDPSLTTELKSSSNPDAPYSYTSTTGSDIDDILDEVEDGDTITILDREVTSVDEFYSVILNANGGTIGSSSAEKLTIITYNGGKFTLPSASRSGYTFEGWKVSTGKTTYNAGATYTVTEDGITLVAQWEKKTYTHSYSLEESSGGSGSSSGDEDNTSTIDTTSSIFTDLSTSHQYYDAIMEAYENGWMVGISDDTFAADGYLTRAMAAQIIWNLEGKPAPEDIAPFIDVTSDAWYADAVAWCYENGIVIGYDYIHYGPNDYLTMEQFCIMLAKYRGEVVPEYTGNSPYATRGWVAYMITA